MATHSSILAWRTPWTEEPGGLQSMGSQRVAHTTEQPYRHLFQRQDPCKGCFSILESFPSPPICVANSQLSFVLCKLFVMSNSATPQTVAHQAPLSMRFSRQEYWNELPFPTPGDLPNPGIKPKCLMFPASAGGFFTTSATWEALDLLQSNLNSVSTGMVDPLIAPCTICSSK